MNYLEVSVAAKHVGRQYYTYKSTKKLGIGSIVQVPYGKKNALGIVRSIVKKPTFETKEIVQALPFVLPRETIQLLDWNEQYYPYDFGEMSNLFIPPNPLVKPRKIITENNNSTTTPMPTPTKDQATALKAIEQNKHTILHGKTGTGKTRVFLEAANKTIKDGNSVLLLTPEIGLTPQLIASVKEHCPAPVFVTHSQMTPAHRRKTWEAALNAKSPSIFIGPRSSIFLPFNNLGLIVIDESHDQSYKNMQPPKYNGVYVAAKLANIHNAKIIQSTATPNVSEYYIYNKIGVPVTKMTEIAAGDEVSHGQVIDISDRKSFSKSKYYSDELLEAIAKSIAKKEQSLIFINRRGSARVIQCNNCGHTEECPNCGLPATYHHDSYEVKCHICGYHQKAKSSCSSCGGTDLQFFALGTKGLEQELIKLFPSAKIARFDLDTKSKDSLAQQLKNIKQGAADIIIGTQLITKGLDLPKLSVVGVLNADSSLQMPDYRSEEIAFQQLYQITGRVGRGHTKSSYYIQTKQPEHPVIQAAVKRDWQEFYDYEIHKRNQFKYPPFSYVAVFKISKAKIETLEASSNKLINKLREINGLVILGPSPSFHEFTNNKYNWQIVVKTKSHSKLLQAAKAAPSDWIVDIDPISLM